ncbi:MAG: GNAT family N-acetyltransferase [Ferruginibacter sp.]|nr:GNAT family N-acetyltransferase [Chitinophagaceae bacterium]MBP6286083.1 GNAT family N-acetyltransferase [Ferruginibacter sp.]MBU9936146.1 GNAT family N-acetyltransferase [Ferruginibacter sp.]HQY11287.1 GNAT family N-acetyltransferase [Ferruginibacter sp.]
MIFREAQVSDIPQIQFVRNAVKENRLSDPSLVPDQDVEEYISNRGRGWVCEAGNRIVGFAIADIVANNIWALFIHPDHEARGIGKKLHRMMLDWYFLQTKETVWLGTEPNSRAEKFYRMQGWKEAGVHGKGEIKFEMDHETWSDVSV